MMLACVFLFLLGAVVGSFLNVLIDRLPEGRSILGRSGCDFCHTPLPWFDLVPLLSFLMLRGRCRFCGAQIPWRLPLVELVTGLGFVGLFWLSPGLYTLPFGPQGLLPLISCTVHCILFSALVVLFFTDLEYGILPDKIIFPAVGVALMYYVVSGVASLGAGPVNVKDLVLDVGLLTALFSAFGLSLFFILLIAVTRGRGMGWGDVKLGFLLGLVLGWPQTLVAAVLSFLLGGAVSAMLVLGGKKDIKDSVPFGSFLVVATGVAAVWGGVIWEWYIGTL